MRNLWLVPATLLMATGCDLTGDWLFPDSVEGYPAVVDLGTITPIASGYLEDADEDGVDNDEDGTTDESDEQDFVEARAKQRIQEGIRYGFIGANSGGFKAGATFTFEGNGGDVCLMVDPELVFWNQAVSGSSNPKYAEPDNVFDDGDIELLAGFSVYYSGTPGEVVGDFYLRYEDSLGNEIPVEFNECVQASLNASSGGFGGRSAPEYCTLGSTQPGLGYTGVLEVWSTPLDDDVVSFGLAVVDMDCNDIIEGIFDTEPECVIKGEALDIDDFAPAPGETFTASIDEDEDGAATVTILGEDGTSYSPVANSAGDDSVSSVTLEEAFCDQRRNPLPNICQDERAYIATQGITWYEYCVENDNRCFCGDETDTPEGGGF